VNEPKGQRPLILVLGAGASFGARSGSNPKPPLGKDLARYLCDWLDANDPALSRQPQRWNFWRDRPWLQGFLRKRLNEVVNEEAVENGRNDDKTAWSKNHGPPFERLMDRWIQNKDDEWLDLKDGRGLQNRHCRELLIATQTLLAYAFLKGDKCAFLKHDDLLDELVARQTPTLVVALNYDLLLEEALVRARKAYAYPAVRGIGGTYFVSQGKGEPSTGEPIPIFKLHGSINWLAHESGMPSQTFAVAHETTRPVGYSYCGSFPVAQTDAIHVPQNRNELFRTLEKPTRKPLVAAIYGSGKPVVANPDDVKKHRAACLEAISMLTSADVLLIGLRPVEESDDPVLCELLDRLSGVPGEKSCVNPEPSDCETFRGLGYRTIQMTMEDWLANTSTDTIE
jgi:hypothetical protein